MLYIRNYSLKQCNKIALYYCTKVNASNPDVNYTNTINLPKTTFPLRLSIAKRLNIEQKLINSSLGKLYNWQAENLVEPEFVLHDGPPYANGDLHMGHAINKILKDIIIKNHISNGRKVHYIPGWDCHGLPIELKAIKNQETVKDSVTVRKIAKQFALQTLEKQKTAFSSWGITGDWAGVSNTYRTLDVSYINKEIQLFYELYKKGLIYRALKPVHWSPSSRTALAEAELEYNNEYESPSAYVRFEMHKVPTEIRSILKNKLYCIIWTTTPWTLPSNQAVCYNEDLSYSVIKFNSDENFYLMSSDLENSVSENIQKDFERIFKFSGRLLSNTTYHHPITNEILPFLNSSHVQSNKGTGLVHTAPAHGSDDFLVSLKYNITTKCFVNEEGIYTNEAPDFLIGRNVLFEGDELVIDHIQHNIIHIGKIKHSYPIDWRTKEPVLFRASEQWFINTEVLKSTALDLVEKVIEFHPKINAEIYKQNLTTQIHKRPYWCISRQRAWGVPIPVFYNKQTGKVVLSEKIIKRVTDTIKKNGGIDFWWSDENFLTNDDLHEFGLTTNDIGKGRDIFDIWFDSGISWSNVLKNDKIADLYLEGVDQCTGWFQSSLLISTASRNQSPYKALFVHGFAVDENGHKMSKSLGNVISPNDIIKKYGTDALRWWVASHAVQHTQITVSTKLLDSSTESLHKIRSVLKYILGIMERTNNQNLYLEETQLTTLDKSIIFRTAEFSEQVTTLYSQYQFNRVTAAIINFITNDISSSYLHLIKDRLYCGSGAEYKNLETMLAYIFSSICKQIWPIAPFLIEEIWNYYDTVPFYQRTDINLPNIQNYRDANTIITKVEELIRIVNQKSNGQNTWNFIAEIACSGQNLALLKSIHPSDQKSDSTELCELLQVARIKLVDTRSVDQYDVKLISCTKDVCARCRRFKLDDADSVVCRRCDIVLKEKSSNNLAAVKA